MVWVKLFKPTVGRIAIFIILFAAIALLDQAFLFFPVSPITYNMFGSAALHFLVFLLIIPYIISCVGPAFYIREFRHAKLHEFVEEHKKKEYPKIEGVIESMEDYEKVQENYAGSLKKSARKPAKKPETKTTKKVRKKPKKARSTRSSRRSCR